LLSFTFHQPVVRANVVEREFGGSVWATPAAQTEPLIYTSCVHPCGPSKWCSK
jgi:hypothetical protein